MGEDDRNPPVRDIPGRGFRALDNDTLEEGGMKLTDATQLTFKRETEPQGLLNPARMVAWEDPAFDFTAGKNFLFPGLEARALPANS
jgi:hypothetical protein